MDLKWEAKIGEDGDWYVLDGDYTSAWHAAGMFAREMINAEWKRYDMKYAEALAKCPVFVRLGDGPIKSFHVSNVVLRLDVSVNPAQGGERGAA